MPVKSFIIIFSISLNNADSLPLSPIVIIFDFSLIIGEDSLFLLFQSNQVRQNLLYFQEIPLNFWSQAWQINHKNNRLLHLEEVIFV